MRKKIVMAYGLEIPVLLIWKDGPFLFLEGEYGKITVWELYSIEDLEDLDVAFLYHGDLTSCLARQGNAHKKVSPGLCFRGEKSENTPIIFIRR